MSKRIDLKMFPSHGGFVNQRGQYVSKQELLRQLLVHTTNGHDVSVRRAFTKPTRNHKKKKHGK